MPNREKGEKPKSDISASDMPRVYSYIRFSTSEQSIGDSERRQLESVKRYAEEKGMVFDNTLCFADRGKSGYHGVHRKKGALGKFLGIVKKGEIPKGSILVVENVDRLSREPFLTAFEIITDLIKKGVNIQTLVPSTYYDIESIDNLIYELIGQIKRAHGESKIKSVRLREQREQARKKAREKKEIMTARCPAWLKVVTNNDGRGYEINPEAADTIKRIYDLKLQGVGKGTIAKILNQNATWKRENGWRQSYVQKILHNRAVIGEYQPFTKDNKSGERIPCGEPIPDYYPLIVEENTFHAVQERFDKNKGKGGRREKISNLFTHLVKCAYCGGPMRLCDKGPPPKGGKYLICDNHARGLDCQYRNMVRMEEVETLILENCKQLNPEAVLPNPNEQEALCQSLTIKIRGYTGELQALENRIKNLTDAISQTESLEIRQRFIDDIDKYDARKKEINQQTEDAERELRQAEHNKKSFTSWKRDLTSLQKALKSGDVLIRMKMQAHLREFIEKIEVWGVGFAELYDVDKDDGIAAGKVIAKKSSIEAIKSRNIKCQELPGGRILIKSPGYANRTETIRDELYDSMAEHPDHINTIEFSNYVKEVVKRRMSKEGRFYRIFFTTDRWVDTMPDGSLASGHRLGVDEEEKKMRYKYISPALERLWQDYKKAKIFKKNS